MPKKYNYLHVVNATTQLLDDAHRIDSLARGLLFHDMEPTEEIVDEFLARKDNVLRISILLGDLFTKELQRKADDTSAEKATNDVIKSVCDCSSETFSHHYKGGDKCGYCGGKVES